MAEPVWKTPVPLTSPPVSDAPEDLEEGPGVTVLRFVERADGGVEQVEIPLTPEIFLNPRIGDQMTQGRRHVDTALALTSLFQNHLRAEPDVIVLCDVKHRFGPGRRQPSPDVSVIRGVRNPKADRNSFDLRKEGVSPCLIVEIVSPLSSRIRRVDLVDKVEIYRRAGVEEYVIADSTIRDRRYRLLGYRLDRAGRYRSIRPDDQGRVLSETTGVWFQVSPEGERIFLLEYPGGRRLLNLEETDDARREAEAEIARLRQELERLRGES